jgi:hypothetical protein
MTGEEVAAEALSVELARREREVGMKAMLKEAAGMSKRLRAAETKQEKAEENAWREKERAAKKVLQEVEKAGKRAREVAERQRKRHRRMWRRHGWRRRR